MTNIASNTTADNTDAGTIAADKPDNIATMLAVALAHAAEGRPVFPCDWRPDSKKPDRPSKNPLTRNGFKDATTDELQIRRWWKQWPHALIGVPTGAASGLAVLDTDIETDPATGEVVKDGEANLQATLAARGWTLPDTVRARTARGGLHRWYRYEPGFRSRTGLLPGIDTRGEGGYVIAPGSRGAVGGPWEYQDASDLVCAVEEAPDWLAHLFRTGKLPGVDGGPDHGKAGAGAGEKPEEDGGTIGAGDLPDETNADDIRKALAGWWNADNYGDWAEAALALHRHPQGRGLWEEWAQTSGMYDPAKADEKWSQTVPKSGITARTILHRVTKEMLRQWARERIASGSSDGGDIANSEAFAERYAGRFACLFPGRTYVNWTGSRWAPCERGEEIEAAKEVAREIVAAAAARVAEGGEHGSKADERRLRAAVALRDNRSKLVNMVELAKSDTRLAVHMRDFDGDPWLLGVQNGVVDLKTGELIAPSPDQRIMRQAGTVYDPKAQCPRWHRFLEEVQPDPEVRAFMQRAVGYTLTGLPTEERIFFLHGTGANGKSVFATVLSRLFGDYHVSIPAATLAKAKYGSNSEADRGVARLPGTRLALANETAQGAIWDDQRLKELASRDPIAARRLYAEGFDFTPTHKLWIRGNHLPGAHDAGDGFWRRLIAIPFKMQFTEAQRIPDLDRQLVEAELSGILTWAVHGCLEWQKKGLTVPAALQSHAENYRRDTDLLGQWMEERLHRDPNGRAPVSEAYRSFVDFSREHGVSAPAQRLFVAQLAERGIETSRGAQGIRTYRDYRITANTEDFADMSGTA